MVALAWFLKQLAQTMLMQTCVCIIFTHKQLRRVSAYESLRIGRKPAGGVPFEKNAFLAWSGYHLFLATALVQAEQHHGPVADLLLILPGTF